MAYGEDERTDPPPTPDPRADRTPRDHPAPAHMSETKWRWGGIALGVVMMVASIALSVAIPQQADMLYIGNRAFMAIGGALASGAALGFMRIDVALARQTISAGGGFAVLVFLFLVNPPAITAVAAAPAQRRVELQDIRQLADAMPERDAAPAGAVLDRIAREQGYRDFRHLSVTAGPEELEAIRESLRRPPR